MLTIAQERKRNKRIAIRYKSGETTTQLATIYNLNNHQITSIIRDQGLSIRTPKEAAAIRKRGYNLVINDLPPNVPFLLWCNALKRWVIGEKESGKNARWYTNYFTSEEDIVEIIKPIYYQYLPHKPKR